MAEHSQNEQKGDDDECHAKPEPIPSAEPDPILMPNHHYPTMCLNTAKDTTLKNVLAMQSVPFLVVS